MITAWVDRQKCYNICPVYPQCDIDQVEHTHIYSLHSCKGLTELSVILYCLPTK